MPNPETEHEPLQRLGEVDRIIHEPARLMILAVLSIVESADFLFLQRQTELTKGNLSSHLSRLEEAGYVQIEKEFVDKIPRTLIRLSPSGRESFNSYRKNLIQVLGDLEPKHADNING